MKNKAKTEERQIIEMVEKDVLQLKNNIRENNYSLNQLKNIHRSEKALNNRESAVSFLEKKIKEKRDESHLNKKSSRRSKIEEVKIDKKTSSENEVSKAKELDTSPGTEKGNEPDNKDKDLREKLIQELSSVHETDKLRKITTEDLKRLEDEK